jgi:carbamoyltransferase
LSSIYLGSSFTNEEIERTLKLCGVGYSLVENPCKAAAELIANDKVIGWFQGQMEFGPRALGNRSILANPCNPRMKEIINGKIKFRESYRPFCPSVLEEDVGLYFKPDKQVSPFMNITFDARYEVVDKIPAVVHVDGTVRVQTVNRGQNVFFYELLNELKKLTGHGLVLNTSFNLSHEPIVCTPRQALSSFFSSGLDALVIGNFLVTKNFT